MKIKVETTYFDSFKAMREFLSDVELLLFSIEKFSEYKSIELEIDRARMEVKNP